MPKLCKVTVSFETLLSADPLDRMPSSEENDEKLKEVEKRLLEKHPTLMGCSNVQIIRCTEHTLGDTKGK